MKIVFIGTSEFSAIILEGLIKNNLKPVLVVTAPDKPVGRKQKLTPPPAKITAQKYNISVLQPKAVLSINNQVLSIKPDLIIVASYGQILPREILDIPKYGCLNVHPSLLPKYRGASPIQNVILSSDKETGVTIFLMDELTDHGSIVVKEKIKISAKENNETLHKKLARLAVKLLLKTIPDWVKGKIKPEVQDESKATFTKVLTRENGKIDWGKPAKEIERQVRAFYPWPGAFAFWQKGDKLLRIKILKAKIAETKDIKAMVGQIVLSSSQKIAVKCEEGFLEIWELQPEGKSPMTAEDFLRGNPEFIGTILK